ncbi:MAG TPA: sigma-70 family RNA polymerase sigma factor [Thermoanaerobaculia bacterium]|nr:sigma-70 family RNA polymerase sigma factor [Thermoanaerobaculia bacterium]
MSDTPRQLFLAYLPFIKQVATHVCRRHGFSREDTDEFVSLAQVKLIEDDYAIFRKYKEKSKLSTYLNVVIQNLFRDHLNHLWGKWRPSQEAKRLGPLAIQLERLMSRDRLSFNEACETLRTNHHVEASVEELAELAAKLPHRAPPRRMESEETLENHPSQELTPDERLESQEAEARWQEIIEILKDVLKQLPAEDALLVKMSCELKVSEIARQLKLDQKPLYRRLEKILNALRQELERRGVRADEVRGLLGAPEDEDDEPRH